MRRITRLAVLAAATMSLLGALTSTAGAVTWHNSGSTTFTATAGTATLSSTGAWISCLGATATGTAPATTVGIVYSISGTATFSSCILSGIATGLDCAYTFTATLQGSGYTQGSHDLTCGVYQFGALLCRISGSRFGEYQNQGTFTSARLGFWSGATLVSQNGPIGTCPLGNGDVVSNSELWFNVTSANAPRITRTA
jgi:hypothetical protein